ncbi:MAG: sodium-dependent transporter [Candidatus Sedimenticola sp. (ex Thyasira tokunagai)]
MSEQISIHGQWSSRLTFILAATGAAVGLGNVWKFPYLVGENGGGAFVLVYLVSIALIGVPVMISEVLIGRRGRQSPINSLRDLAGEARSNCRWQYIGALGMVAGLIITSYYSVIAGWTLAYAVRMAGGVFSGVTKDGAESIFAFLVSDPERMLAWHTLFIVMTAMVVSRGVRSGLEHAIKILMPALFLLLLILVGYAYISTNDHFGQGVSFMFNIDFAALTTGGVLTAMGHAFFTLSLGAGAVMVYGSYLPSDVPIAKTVLAVAAFDTIIALLAGLAVFPLVFASELAPASGPGLIFLSLPIAFGHMPFGWLFGTLFFILLLFAAWTSAIALLEPMVAWLVENRQVQRIRAAVWVGLFTWLLGVVSILSFGAWSFEFDFAGEVRRHGVYDLLDILSSSIILPIGGFAIALFAGWVLPKTLLVEELGGRTGTGFRLWYAAIRIVAPAALLLILLGAIGVI